MDELPEGTPTGRFVEDHFPTPTYVRKLMEDLENSPEFVILGSDFSDIEARTVAMIVGRNGSSLTVDRIHELDLFRGYEASLILLDECADIPVPTEKLFTKPVKQNGKDASYLALDPTKKHRRRR